MSKYSNDNNSYKSLYSSKTVKIPNINGNGQDNVFFGTSDAERFNGGGWDDYIISGNGNDFVNGNGGFDILKLSDSPLDYKFYQDSYNSWHIEKFSTGEVVGFKNIEQINFNGYNIEINGEDNTPYAENIALSTLEDTNTQQFDLQSITWDLERDLTGNALTFKIEMNTVSDHGSYTITEEGLMIFTPTDSYAGQDEFTYTVYDGVNEETRTVSIDVEAVADVPDLVVEVIAGDNVNEVVLDISTMLNDLDGSEELQLFFNGMPDGVLLYDAQGNLIGEDGIFLGNGSSGHDLLLTMVLPKSANWDFPLEVIARSTELQNTENSVTIAVPTATASSIIEIDYGVEYESFSSEFLSNDQNIWEDANADYISASQFLGIDTDTNGGFFGTVDYEIDLRTGIETEVGVKGGVSDSGMSFDMDFINYHNYTTNMLEVETSYEETDSWFETEDVVTFIDIDAIMDIYAKISFDITLDLEIYDVDIIDKSFTVDADYDVDIFSFQSDDELPLNLAFSIGSISVGAESIEIYFPLGLGSFEVFRSYDSAEGTNSSDGSVSLDVADVTLDIDQIVALIAGVPGLFGSSYTVPPFGSVSYDFIDFDIVGGMDVELSFDQDFVELYGELYVDNVSADYTVGDTLVFNDVADDASISTLIDVDGILYNDTDLVFNLDYVLTALGVGIDVEASVDIPGIPAVVIEGVTITPAIPGYTISVEYEKDATVWETTDTLATTEVGLYDGSTDLDFDDQSYILFA